MEYLNYNHLYYFWVVAREGSIAKATEVLHLTQPTISMQLRQLEESLGEKLLTKSGRGLALTEPGRVTFRYADEIFTLGRELRDTLRDRPTGKATRMTVGIADVVPKLVAYRVLRPAFEAGADIEIVCREASTDVLLAQLGQHEVDLVITDGPVSGSSLRGFNHFLGESGTTLFASAGVAASARKTFPESLNGAPLLLPGKGTHIRRALDQWIEEMDLHPRRVAEFDDLALMTVFGRAGIGIFPAPTALEHELQSQYNVRVAGRLPEVKERFYAISGERRIKNPIVSAITNAARRELFEGGTRGR
ncbi:MAG TPA: transcriptional activator NhaR [Thermoanaerobaculia bacterium]|nr:transcriptional activator NhaR [Thermoanaerobaculia bacterium]